jgi:PPM family protein phosphatase
MHATFQTAAGNPENQDRGIIVHHGLLTVLCVADGAGGLSGGAEAAGLATEMVRQRSTDLRDVKHCVDLFRQIDLALAEDSVAGETTCALAVVSPSEVFGASVGDSSAWLIPEDGAHLDLTAAQCRKPFLGSGVATPVRFHCSRQAGSLLLATDGLLRNTSAERIADVCRRFPGEEAARQLIELVRYPSGALPDDVTVILAQL